MRKFACSLITLVGTAAQAQLTPEQLIAMRRLADLRWSPDARALAFTITDPPSGTTVSRHVWVSTDAPHQYTYSAKSEDHARWSPDGKRLAFLSDRDQARPIYIMPVDGGDATALTRGKPAIESFEWSPDGKPIALLGADPKTDADQKREDDKDDAHPVDRPRAARTSRRLSTCTAARKFGDWGGGDFKDIMAGVDYLMQRGIADPDRLGIAGWSYGGYMAEWAITQTTRFKAAVSGAGLSDLASEYGTEDQNARTPTLILQGDNDVIDPMGQSQELYRALKRYGVTTELVVYPREGHGFRKAKHLTDRLRRIVACFDQYTGPHPSAAATR